MTNTTPKILLTGGAGYIGTHIAYALLESGYAITVVDNLSTGDKELLPPETSFHHGDICDLEWLQKVFHAEKPDGVIHLAALASVDESVEKPLLYYRNNTTGTINVLSACHQHGIEKFVFSSTCAVYGNPQDSIVREDAPLVPVSPYGTSKKLAEDIIRDTTHLTPLRAMILRYFNVVGSDPKGRTGLVNDALGRLDIRVCQAVDGTIPYLELYGTDYDTHDGTAVRDYIHVSDLASAHVKAVDHLLNGGASDTLNVGYGKGYSVRDYIKAAKAVSGVDFTVQEKPRRAGDTMSITADTSHFNATLPDWTAEFDNLETIIQTSLDWRAKKS